MSLAIPEIIICGSLCNTDIAVAELLSRYKLNVKVLRYKDNPIKNIDTIEKKLKYFCLDNIIYVSNAKEAYSYLERSSLIVSLTGAIDNFLKARKIFSRNYKILPKTINITTGADITELVRLKTMQGRKFYDLLNRTLFNFFNPYPEVIKSIRMMKLKNYQIVKSPYYLLDPLTVKQEEIKPVKNNDVTIRYFHVSHLDWGHTDGQASRNTTKGNDRFLKAFIRALESGAKIACKILLRGPDSDLAQQIISHSGHINAFEFLPEVEQGELSKMITNADVIVDQFDVGAIGGIACESMAQAKPVMVHIDKNCWPLAYDDEPPVINCHTEDEIYHAIMACSDRKELRSLGARAEKWVRKYYDVHTADFSQFMLRIFLALGHQWVPESVDKDL